MKRLILITGIIILAGIIAIPAVAFGPYGRWGGHMMGPWGGGPYQQMPYGGPYSNLTDDERQKIDELYSKFYQDTQSLRNKLWTKRNELNLLKGQENPDTSKITALEKEISELQGELFKKRAELQLQLQKIAPQFSGYGRWRRGPIGGGWNMMDWGPYHMGAGACWW